jgi:NADPH:quinone reductase
MRAMVIPEFGGPEVFEERELDRPEPGPGELLVRVVASGTNPVEAKVRSGAIPAVEPPTVLGYDASGVVEEVGPGVEEFQPGDEVYFTPEIFGTRIGSYAEYNTVPAGIVARKPANLSHVEAAAVPLAGGTAYEAVVRRLNVRPGEAVLIHGGAGGVGTFAVQVAKAAGAFVIATAGPDNQGTLSEVGADVAVDYRSQSPAEAALEHTGGAGVDAVFDTVGGQLEGSQEATRAFGRLASILPIQGDFTHAYLNNQTLYGVFLTRERQRLVELTRLIEQGKLRPVVDEVLPLAGVSRAHERLDSGHGRGKVVLEVSGG